MNPAQQEALWRDGLRWRRFRKLCGYVENSTEKPVKLYQDDATKGWTIVVGYDSISSKPRIYRGDTLDETLDTAYKAEVPPEDQTE